MAAESGEPDLELQSLEAPRSSIDSPERDSAIASPPAERQSLAETGDDLERNEHEADDDEDYVDDADVNHDTDFRLTHEVRSQGEVAHAETNDGEAIDKEVILFGEVIHGEVIHGKVAYGEIDHEDTAEEGVAEVVQESLLDDATLSNDAIDAKPMWRPTWLRSEVLATFTGIFLAITIAIPVLLWYSERHNGIMKSHEKLMYAWRFGPIAVLTLIAAFWGRVELQAMRYAPYIALNAHGQSISEEDYALDYMSMSSPKAFIHSLRRKHHLVYFTALTSLLIKAQITLASGLFGLVHTYDENVNVKILDFFNTSASVSLEQHMHVYYAAQAVQIYEMPYPFGVSRSVAYQTFQLEGDTSGRTRGSAYAPLKIVVDAFHSELHCTTLRSYTAVRSNETDDGDTFDLDLYFRGCDSVVHVTNVGGISGKQSREKFLEQPMERNDDLELEACSAIPQQHKQRLIVTGVVERSDDPFSAELTSIAAVICSPLSWMSRVEVVDDGANPQVIELPELPTTVVDVDIWEIAAEVVPFSPDNFLTPLGAFHTMEWWDFPGNEVEAVFNNSDALADSLQSFMSNMTSLLGHHILRQRRDYSTKGSTFVPFSKLKIAPKVSIYLTVVSATATFTTCLTYVFHRRNHSAWSCNPTTILGSFLLLCRHKTVGSHASNCSSMSSMSLWTNGEFSFAVLRSWVQALVTGCIATIMFWLIFNETKYDAINQLTPVDAGVGSRARFLWTSGTTLIMLSISLYANARNTAHRSLCTLWALASSTCSSREIDQSLLDMLGIRALYESIRLKVYSAAFSQLLAFACAVLPTLSSVLLSLEGLAPEIQSHQLRQSTRFTTQRNNWTEEDVVGLRATVSVLMTLGDDNNITYPNNTYGDLIFPILSSNGVEESRVISAEALVPAARLEPTCHRIYDAGHSVSTHDNSTVPILSFYNFYKQPFTCPNGTQKQPEEIVVQQTLWQHGKSGGYSYFGTKFTSPRAECIIAQDDEPKLTKTLAALSAHSNQTSMQTYYIWGAYSWAQKDFDSLFMWQCDYAWAEIKTRASLVLVDDKWAIDSKRPPGPDTGTSKPWSPSFHVLEPLYEELYPTFPWFGSALEIDFRLLLRPYGKFSLEALKTPKEQKNILRGLNRNIGIAAAQAANIYSRTYINASSQTTATSELSEVSAKIVYKARYRIAQSTPVTYTIVGILAAVLLANVWSLISTFMRRFGRANPNCLMDMKVEGLAPDGFGNLAAMASLTRASNISSFLPQDAHSMSSKEIHVALSGLGFRLGWFENRKGPEARRHFTVGVLEDREFVFMGSKEDIEVEEMREGQEVWTEERSSERGAEQTRRRRASSEEGEEVSEELTHVIASRRS